METVVMSGASVGGRCSRLCFLESTRTGMGGRGTGGSGSGSWLREASRDHGHHTLCPGTEGTILAHS